MNIQNLFATPLLVVKKLPYQVPYNDQLKALILERAEREESFQLSSRKAWQSSRDLYNWEHPAIKELNKLMHKLFVRATAQYLGVGSRQISLEVGQEAWANVHRQGSYHAPHIHGGYTWSGVYYVCAELGDNEASEDGIVEFMDPRTHAAFVGLEVGKKKVRLKPNTGMAIVFPSWLEHWVHPYCHSNPRISVGYNINVIRVIDQ